jgi:hypothetical protein
MKTTQEKVDALIDAVESYETARDEVADAICLLCEDLEGVEVAERLEAAEPDAAVAEALRLLAEEIDSGGYVSEDEDEDDD